MTVNTIPRRRFLHTAALGALAAGLRWRVASAGLQKPNILFILADDMGYADLSVYGQTDYRTPHIDTLATDGVRLTQAYANSAVCSATRFALITGRYQYRLRGGLEEPIPGASDTIGLPPSHPTLPSLLRAAGYHTALIGKWHLGSLPNFGPLKSGYEEFFGNYGGDVDYFTHKPEADAKTPEDLYEGEVPVHRAGYYTTLLGDRAVDYLERVNADVPFFLSLHFTAPHWPWEGPDDEAVSRELKDIFDYDGGNLAVYGRMVEALDEQVGRVLETLSRRGLADNTIVVFTSDNGGERFSKMWPFTGQKTELLEGGIRVPALIRWPHQLPAGSVCSQVAISMDWLPTLLAAVGGEPDPAYPSDGINLLPMLRDATPPVERTLYWRYKANHQRAVRSGDWKYLKINDNEFLFDVVVDQRERANLAQKHPDILADLKKKWAAWDRQMLPIPRKSYSHSVTPAHQADHYRPQD
ncbi:MAG TPA: sulfatase-like hydrolase/transferase [Steroidobacteraceae bacterium]|nr:sulfatase-like hydrolase/transferase [Steroidobacteraceae bacterium]